jgi:hypothetical protein
MSRTNALVLLFFSMMVNFYLVLPYGWATILTFALMALLIWVEDRSQRRKNSD